jgi:hypothetical protein
MVTQDEWMQATATAPLNMTEMDALILASKEAWDDYDTKRKVATLAHDRAEDIDRQIIDALKKAGKSKYFVDGLGTMSIIPKSIVRVPGTIEAKKEFFKYLRSISEEVLYSLATVNSNSLNSWYAARLDEASGKGVLGFSVPGLDQPTMRETLRLTADRKAKNNGKEE